MKVIIALNTGDTVMEQDLMGGLFDSIEAVEGVYKGVKEDSYIVTLSGRDPHYDAQVSLLKWLGRLFKQESILFVHDNEGYEAELLYIGTGEIVDIGTFESEIDGSLPAGVTDYTRSKQTGRHYFVR